jgi:hypothetical protein
MQSPFHGQVRMLLQSAFDRGELTYMYLSVNNRRLKLLTSQGLAIRGVAKSAAIGIMTCREGLHIKFRLELLLFAVF